ncbi:MULTISPECIES: hypothetical protein [unclassified Vibrio]|uniref:hypothetical protein n=1 Tax=unclassified Vibrio TaxID=2614977 RepID=UPI0025542FCF|nr:MULTISPECIES: hypothetical protein [unclassified Vibrio]MDK9778558.1 hypothetical protein [Vibrio sp. D401a]MDK9803693.1 hypothetical protein [Vibrio sp. D406a]
MKQFKTLAVAAAMTLSGCATVIQGTDDTVNVRALNTDDRLTQCLLSSDEGSWYTQGKQDTVVVKRDYSDIAVKCENDTQVGTAIVESNFQAGWLLADFFWDLCLITLSCPIDAATGAFYDYPREINVKMSNKGDAPQEMQIIKNEPVKTSSTLTSELRK